ncbi:MAG: hypothetical protein ACRDCE_18510 [Cetobacterium sp.]|uniref:hypothetical protein n=1 Tax=Cetobacterium sp. TaxID=2071632 RepID=UPI003EE80112
MMISKHKVALVGGSTALMFNPEARWAIKPVANVNSGSLMLFPTAVEETAPVGSTMGVVAVQPGFVLEFSDEARIDAMIAGLTALKEKMLLAKEVASAQSLLNEARAAMANHQITPSAKAE